LLTTAWKAMTWYTYGIKILATSGLIVAVTEASNRSTLLAALLASIPIVSVVAMMWMNHEGVESAEISAFARDIVWLVIPSLLLFLLLPQLLTRVVEFYPALGVSVGVTIAGYLLMLKAMQHFGMAA